MGKPTGFLEFAREPAHARPPLERVQDWSESHPPYEERTLREQAARCMDCGVPFCHAGVVTDGAAAGCPVNNLVPEWNDLVYRGYWREAYVRLRRTNNFPEFTGRVCPAPCEASCTVGINAEPVTIKTIEREIVDRAWESGWVTPEPPLARTGHRVAIVGSGPAGLACADQLNRAGHDVTVFERSHRLGGLLTYGIPQMKLDKFVVERRLQLMADEGVRFLSGIEIGPGHAGIDVLSHFDAVVLCLGSTVARDLPVQGRDLDGVHLAMDYLGGNAQHVVDPARGGPDARISATGRDVVVIGGGDTGTDCVGTSIRQGARSITQLEILERPPDERAPDNPWPRWPRVYRMDYGQEEAAALWGADPRRYAVQTRRFTADESGRLGAVETVGVEWVRGPDGRSAPREVAGTDAVISADLALLALGFVGPEPSLPEALGCEIGARGTIATDADGMTTVPGVFAAGDCSRGQSLVVWAIREGRLAARAVDRYLMHNVTVLLG
jgi:glutamate synthase (NADPH/NADH) small chain